MRNLLAAIFALCLFTDSTLCQTHDVFPLAPGYTVEYEVDASYCSRFYSILTATRDSGRIIYRVTDSTSIADSMVRWDVTETRALRHWRGQYDGEYDTSWSISATNEFHLSESRSGFHELRAVSGLWMFPVPNHRLDSLRIHRFADTDTSLVWWQYSCPGFLPSFDSMKFSADTGLILMRWRRCEDFGDMFGSEESGSARLVRLVRVSVEDDLSTQLPERSMVVHTASDNSRAVIRYSLREASELVLEVYNLLGEKIETVEQTSRSSGEHTAYFDLAGRPSGMYFVSLRTAFGTTVTKFVLLR